MIDVKPGDKVTRVISGLRMPLHVTAVDDKLIHCGPWTFERASGVEYDPGLGWGTHTGVTGSYIEVEEK